MSNSGVQFMAIGTKQRAEKELHDAIDAMTNDFIFCEMLNNRGYGYLLRNLREAAKKHKEASHE